MNSKSKILTILATVVVVLSLAVGWIFSLLFTSNAPGTVFVVSLLGCFLTGLVLLIFLAILLRGNEIVSRETLNAQKKDREALSKQLHHSQKFEAVGKLVSSIAHDFNNLLTIIDGYSSLIIANPGAEQNGRHAKEVVEAARKASYITRKLLNFSRMDQEVPERIDLNNVLLESKQMLSHLIGDQIVLEMDDFGQPLSVRSDPNQLGQVLMNLIVNARDAMPAGGRISMKLSSRMVEDDECSKPPKIPDGMFAELAVQDTGCGMTEEVRSRIFEAFFTTKPEGQGTGLGLSIVKSIMKEHHGFINVRSVVGEGTTFYLYFPLDGSDDVDMNPVAEPAPVVDEPTAQLEEESVSAGPAGAATILLVEDDEAIRNLVHQTLIGGGYSVLVAEDGWHGIKMARTCKEQIDLLFSDLMMPGLSGAELAVALRELFPEIQILLMSGYSRNQMGDEPIPPGTTLLEKPFMPDQVLSRVKELLAR